MKVEHCLLGKEDAHVRWYAVKATGVNEAGTGFVCCCGGFVIHRRHPLCLAREITVMGTCFGAGHDERRAIECVGADSTDDNSCLLHHRAQAFRVGTVSDDGG